MSITVISWPTLSLNPDARPRHFVSACGASVSLVR